MSYASDITTLALALIEDKKTPMLRLIKNARHNECPPDVRLGAYTNGYAVRLEEATGVDYPALQQYLGDEAFKKLVAEYVRATPSAFWDLNLYSIAFADFIKAHSSDKAAHAIAVLESTLIDVFWKPDSKPLTPDALQTLSEETLAQQIFTLRTASQLLLLDHAVNAYFEAFQAGNAPRQPAHVPEYLLVMRGENGLKRLALEPEEYRLLAQLHAGKAFGEALGAMSDGEALAAKLPGYLARWLSQGFFAAQTSR